MTQFGEILLLPTRSLLMTLGQVILDNRWIFSVYLFAFTG